ncbi:hypothetical protein [Burkholderia cepacia]|uniref:hypothetical protein n=1 Tax=Burkholderia cepacia TaxID=292 RepID=UPI0015885B49|nr:hypothetical protein [Burkholderia cepacia]
MGVKVTSHIGREKTGGDLFLTVCDYEWKPLGFLGGLLDGVLARIAGEFSLSTCGALPGGSAGTKRSAGAASDPARARRTDERVSWTHVKLARLQQPKARFVLRNPRRFPAPPRFRRLKTCFASQKQQRNPLKNNRK